MTFFPLFLACNMMLAQKHVYSQVEVDRHATFPFGEDSLQKFIGKNMKWADNHVSGKGTIWVSFLVNKRGKITSPAICKSNFWESFEKEALRIVKLMPRWTPAIKDKKKVCSKVEIPIIFEIH